MNLSFEFDVYELSEYEKYNKIDEFTDKAILDESVLKAIFYKELPQPWIFKAINIATEGTENEKIIYFAVKEFASIIPKCYFPHRMRKYLENDDGTCVIDIIPLSKSLPKGTFCMFKPINKNFLLSMNEHGVEELLENLLKSYTVLQLHTIIELNYNGIVYSFEICELKPSSVVLIINTDLVIDFDIPKTPKTPKLPPLLSSSSEYDYVISDSDGDNITISGSDMYINIIFI